MTREVTFSFFIVSLTKLFYVFITKTFEMILHHCRCVTALPDSL